MLILIMLPAQTSWAADYYSVGVDCFKKGVYDKSISNLEHAIRINPKNVNARYYLAQAYIKQSRVNEAKNQYTRIIILAPNSDAAVLSQKGLCLVTQAEAGKAPNTPIAAIGAQSASFGDNYLSYVLTGDDKIIKWASFPLTVYIEPKKQKSLAQNAFKQWQEKSGNLVSFNFVNSPQKAQITVSFKDKLETSSSKDSYIAGYSKPYYQGENIIKSEINILTYDAEEQKDVEDNFVLFSTLHEIGHSLGFRGHSPNSADIMATEASEAKLQLTQRDINTLIAFYKTDKHTLLANKGSEDVQLQQALEYAKRNPDKSVSWVGLGDIYKNKKNYKLALQNYQKAASIEPNKAEIYNLIGTTYQEMGDNQNAFTNLKKACDLDSSNSFYIYQFAQLCQRTGQKAVGKSYLNAYVKNNPNDEKINTLLKSY